MSYELNSNDIYAFASYVMADTHTKGDELFFKFCPYCEGGSHRDKNSFSINLNTGAYSCFRATCGAKGHFVELCRDFGFTLDFGIPAKKFRELPQAKPKVSDHAVEYLKKRGISEQTTKKYYITAQKNNPDILVFPFYDENNKLQFIKYRNTKFVKGKGSKEFCEKDCKPILFGMAQCVDFETAVITEGQIDSLTLAECGIPNALSVPTGCNGFTWLQHCREWLERFKRVIIFGDYEKGRMTLLEDLKKLNTNVLAVKPIAYLGEKDANDIFLKFGKDAIVKAVESAEKVKSEHILRMADVKSVDIINLPKIKTGIYELDRAIYGLYYGQLILLSGKRGEGKSTFMSQLVAEAVEQDQAVLVYSGELPTYHVKNWLDLQIAGKDYVKIMQNEYGDKALECHTLPSGCNDCPYVDKSAGRCSTAMAKDAFGLIKRQQTEIERLNIDLKAMRGAANSWKAEVQRICKKEFDNIEIDIEAVKSTAVREFAGRLKEYCNEITNQEWNKRTLPVSWADAYEDFIDDIDRLLEEMGCNDGK